MVQPFLNVLLSFLILIAFIYSSTIFFDFFNLELLLKNLLVHNFYIYITRIKNIIITFFGHFNLMFLLH